MTDVVCASTNWRKNGDVSLFKCFELSQTALQVLKLIARIIKPSTSEQLFLHFATLRFSTFSAGRQGRPDRQWFPQTNRNSAPALATRCCHRIHLKNYFYQFRIKTRYNFQLFLDYFEFKNSIFHHVISRIFEEKFSFLAPDFVNVQN